MIKSPSESSTSEKTSSTSMDKIDFHALLNDFQVPKLNIFIPYLKEIWRVNINIKPIGSFAKN
jgi:hypothetical protein